MTDHTRPPWADLPHSGAIDALLDELHTLSRDEARDMGAAWGAGWESTGGVPWGAAWYAARDAAWDAGRAAAMGATLRDALDAVWGVAWGAAWYAVRDAALAIVVVDLVGQHGLTRDHLDTLTGPARVVPRLAKIIDRALPTICR